MRFGIATILALLFLTAPAAAQRNEAAEVNSQLTEAGRWFEKIGTALAIGSEGFQELSQGMQALVATASNREQASAAVPELRRRIERIRADMRRSNAMLDALPPFPPGVAPEISPKQMLAEARAYTARMLSLLDSYDDFIIAVGKSDLPAMDRALPRLTEGAFAMIGQQRLLVRQRQAGVPVSESSHQALGIAGQLYKAMESVARHLIAAKTGTEAGAAKAAADLGAELRLVADETGSLAAAGRRNLKREIAEIDASPAGRNAAEVRLRERVRRVFAAEGETFAIADRLVAFAESNRDVTPERLRTTGRTSLFPPLKQLEMDYTAIGLKQAALLADGQ